MRGTGHAAHMITIKIYENFGRKSEGQRLIWRSRYVFEDNIKMYFKEMVEKDVEWVYVTHNVDYRGTLLRKTKNFRFHKML
jgi:hypothetical protein